MATTQKNEGEGNRTAAKAYNKATTAFAKSGKVAPAAAKAKKSLASKNEAAEMKKAEEIGKKPAGARRDKEVSRGDKTSAKSR
jgi:hypothetical protein